MYNNSVQHNLLNQTCGALIFFPPLQVFFTCKTSVRKEAFGEEHQQRQRTFTIHTKEKPSQAK
jgi:hypothetical protein